MKVVPNRPHDNESRAELIVFDALASTEFVDHCPIAFHSLFLTDHAEKRVGEADFVIVSKYGLFVLEVKGGGINVINGDWSTTGQKGTFKIQDPFKQANTAVHAIDAKIKKLVETDEVRIPIGYAVVFPNVIWKQKAAEWDREMVCDRDDLSNFNQWLKELFEYWNCKRPANANLLSQADIDAISLFLRPNFEIVQPLFDQVKQVEQVAVKLTEEQYHFVDIAMENRRVICSGGAGTGKTFLAAELARRMLNAGKNVLLVCKSSWLRHYLTARIPNERLTVATISSVASVMRRLGLDAFDVLIMDEGQDLLNFKDLNLLDSILSGGFVGGQWYFFHDSNNQSNLLATVELGALDWLKSQSNPAVLKLRVNCRNTSNILGAIQSKLQCDVGKPTLVGGSEVTEYIGNSSELLEKLEALIKYLISSELDSGAITILSSVQKRKSIVAKLSPEVQAMISELDDYKVRKIPFDGITFSQIKDFKGLENDVIILVDLPPPNGLAEGDCKALYYVGMSRARAILYCFWSDELL
ncbi:MAG TPA: NERD domain-containing protein [Agitococcus sp.]|nr:NERD domain-containing protein [Agitococcus sp.]